MNNNVMSAFLEQGDNKKFGEWSKHTTGFGLKSMLAMGYKPGVGLGKDKEGRLEPVPVKKLKKNAGLDYASKEFVPKAKKVKINLPPNPNQTYGMFDALNTLVGKKKKKKKIDV